MAIVGVPRVLLVSLTIVIVIALPQPAAANAESARLRAHAYELAYNLDYPEATRDMRSAVAADPKDIAAERGLAVIPWLEMVFRRGAVTVDDYLGGLSRQQVALRQPPADLAMAFAEHIERARQMAEARVQASPRDPDALYELGATIALQSSYIATVEGRVLGAFRNARRAYDLHEQVLELQPDRADAGLVVGTYRYIVSIMSLPMRMMAYVAGFGGGKERGLELIETAAARGGEARTDARFALVLLYNREKRYADAMRVITDLQREYPRNRIVWLEAGATSLRAGRANEAERHLATGLRMLASDTRPRMRGEEALWLQKHGAALVALNRLDEAERDLTRALTLDSRTWVTGRVHLELGRIADLRGKRSDARMRCTTAVRLCEEDNDPIGAAAARPWISQAYHR
jgi:tetratricopeptide (TPR) repeat protein